MTEHLVLDASFGWPDLKAAKAAGYSGIIGYLSDDPKKNLTAARVKEAEALGMSVNVVWEDSAQDFATMTLAQAKAVGKKAATQKAAVGLPAWVPVFAAVDFNAAPSQFSKITANVLAFASTSGSSKAAIYAEAPLIDFFVAHGGHYGWQPAAASWSGYKVSPNACLLQRVSPTVKRVAGSYDENVVLKPDFGAFPAPHPAPVPAAHAAPAPVHPAAKAAPAPSKPAAAPAPLHAVTAVDVAAPDVLAGLHLPDYARSVIRTVTPAVVGQVGAVLALAHVTLSPTMQAEETTAVGLLLGAGYYAAVRGLERRWPSLGWLLGATGAPTYTPAS